MRTAKASSYEACSQSNDVMHARGVGAALGFIVGDSSRHQVASLLCCPKSVAFIRSIRLHRTFRWGC